MLLSKSDSICGLLNRQFWLTYHVCNFWSHTVIPPKYHSIHGDPCGSTSNDQQWSRTTSYHLGHTCFAWKQGIPQKVRWFGTSIPALLIQSCKLCHTINFISGWYSSISTYNHTMVGCIPNYPTDIHFTGFWDPWHPKLQRAVSPPHSLAPQAPQALRARQREIGANRSCKPGNHMESLDWYGLTERNRKWSCVIASWLNLDKSQVTNLKFRYLGMVPYTNHHWERLRSEVVVVHGKIVRNKTGEKNTGTSFS